MELPAFLPVVVLGLFALAGAWTDIRSRTIPNVLVLVTALAGLAFPAIAGEWNALLMHLAHFGVALLIGLGLYAAKFWGGGDGKFYAAVAAWFPINDFFLLMFAISVVGLFLVLGVIAKNGGKMFARGAASVPYGVAIGLGGLMKLTWAVW